jgi:beta-galactosidase
VLYPEFSQGWAATVLRNGKWNWYLSALVAVCLSIAVSAAISEVATPATSSALQTPLWLGTAWYPEQWPEARWNADLALMENAGIHFVRIGEFAWSTMEPAEGEYKFDWVERAIALAAKHHIQVVLGTPTAAPPAWLTQKYPETLRIEEDGRPDEHGNRQQFNWSNPKYRELAHDIAFRMADRFGHNPNVIGWQIDNEYASESYGSKDRQRFQEWLKSRYGCAERALDDRLLERKLHRLGPDSNRNQIRKSRALAQLEAVRERHMAWLSEKSD